MLESGAIVVGTDTGIGKTFVTAALLLALRTRGADALPMKPVQTGAENNRAPDIDFCLRMADIECDDALYNTLAPYRFPLPASPHFAAQCAKTTIDPRRILDAFYTLRAAGHTPIIEAAGGILVPLTDSLLQIDLLRELNLPFLLVARPSLGTLNHTLLTIEALQNRKAEICAVALNCLTPDITEIEEDNLNALKKWHPGLSISFFPHLNEVTAGTLTAAGTNFLSSVF
ncbi:MAG: dethiobiotin synthase [Kiritimatiellae bacterium]|nr:dethiobiotin synthase [Kiritimatiellia bacterium]